MENRPLSVAILVGGLGTRLQPLLADRPKALAPVAGRPFLCFLLDLLVEAGFSEVVLLTGHRGDQIRDQFGDSYQDLHLLYSHEPSPLGTAGALRHALPLLKAPDILVLNGDSFLDLDYQAFLAFHTRGPRPVSMALARVADTTRFGKVQLETDDRVSAFLEKDASGGPGWVNAGIYLLQRSLLLELPVSVPLSLERDLFPARVCSGELFGMPAGNYFIDIGTPESLLLAEAFFASFPWGQASSRKPLPRPDRTVRVRR